MRRILLFAFALGGLAWLAGPALAFEAQTLDDSALSGVWGGDADDNSIAVGDDSDDNFSDNNDTAFAAIRTDDDAEGGNAAVSSAESDDSVQVVSASDNPDLDVNDQSQQNVQAVAVVNNQAGASATQTNASAENGSAQSNLAYSANSSINIGL